ncbi:hypothetical protein J6590_060444 [Homalodisca vitripennis]|nr:hypothetical protein J6590_060444 [Homalodisca vitripennis]
MLYDDDPKARWSNRVVYTMRSRAEARGGQGEDPRNRTLPRILLPESNSIKGDENDLTKAGNIVITLAVITACEHNGSSIRPTAAVTALCRNSTFELTLRY